MPSCNTTHFIRVVLCKGITGPGYLQHNSYNFDKALYKNKSMFVAAVRCVPLLTNFDVVHDKLNGIFDLYLMFVYTLRGKL